MGKALSRVWCRTRRDEGRRAMAGPSKAEVVTWRAFFTLHVAGRGRHPLEVVEVAAVAQIRASQDPYSMP